MERSSRSMRGIRSHRRWSSAAERSWRWATSPCWPAIRLRAHRPARPHVDAGIQRRAYAHLGEAKRYIDLTSVRSIRELQEKVRAKAAQLGVGEWITGYGWAEDNFAEQRLPNRADLDAAAPASPVILMRAGGHSSVSNSRALGIASITRETTQPADGMIEHDATGEPTGIIRESNTLVDRFVPVATAEELRPSFTQSLRDQLSFGITSLVMADESAENWPESERVYRENPATAARRRSDSLEQRGRVAGIRQALWRW